MGMQAGASVRMCYTYAAVWLASRRAHRIVLPERFREAFTGMAKSMVQLAAVPLHSTESVLFGVFSWTSRIPGRGRQRARSLIDAQ